MSDGAIVPPGCIDDIECLKEYGSVHYIPSTAGNALFLGIFGAALIAQLYLGIRHKTWGYMAAMLGGTLLEIVGYVGRIMMIDDVFNENNFIIYLIGLTIGPAFYSAAIYLCFSRIVNVYGNTLSLLRPKIVTIIFIGGDFISLVLQAAGGAIASTAENETNNDMGVNIMIAGLATQVAATTIFGGFCLHLIWAIRKYPNKVLHETIQFRRTLRFRGFLAGKSFSSAYILSHRTNSSSQPSASQHYASSSAAPTAALSSPRVSTASLPTTKSPS